MTVRLKLGSYLYTCPLVWQNFIKDLDRRAIERDSTSEGFSIDTINQELAPYSAQYIQIDHQSSLDFADESCYSLFALRYGGAT